MTHFEDLYTLGEDERIRRIAEHVLGRSDRVAVLVDDEREKIDRYTRKLAAAGVSVLRETPGPVARVVTLTLGRLQ